MKTLLILSLSLGAFLPLSACTKTVVHDRDGANPSVVRENNTVIREKSSPTVIERETRY